MSNLELGYGRGAAQLVLPSRIRFDALDARPLPAISLDEAFRAAWEEPYGITDPTDLFRSGDRIVLIVNDHTRPTPTRQILRLLWDRIDARVAPAHVTVVVGTGTHRAPTGDELEAILGPFRTLFDVRIHDCDRDLINVGVTSRGTPVLLNRVVAEADCVVAIGHIGTHYYAGYSGGRKGILPGVAGRTTIDANHAQLTDPRCRACSYCGNPISDEMVEAAAKVPFALTIDVVLAGTGGVAKVFLGEPEAAHAAGRAFWDANFQVPFDAPYDLVVASAGGHPKDINLYQAHKALYNAMRTVRDGGILYVAAACPDGIGHAVFEDWVNRSPDPEDVARLYEKEGFILGGHKALYLAQDAKRATIYLHSELDDDTVRRYYMQPARTLDPVLAAAKDRFGTSFRTLIIPHAADLFPIPSSATAWMGLTSPNPVGPSDLNQVLRPENRS